LGSKQVGWKHPPGGFVTSKELPRAKTSHEEQEKTVLDQMIKDQWWQPSWLARPRVLHQCQIHCGRCAGADVSHENDTRQGTATEPKTGPTGMIREARKMQVKGKDDR
jgi:hypothetical protein